MPQFSARHWFCTHHDFGWALTVGAAGFEGREIATLADRTAAGIHFRAPLAPEIGLARLRRLEQGGRSQSAEQQKLLHLSSPGLAGQCECCRAPAPKARHARFAPLVARRYKCSIEAENQPDQFGVSCTILPPTMVMCAVVSASLSSAAVSGSALSTARSAYLPTSSEPFLASSNVRYAPVAVAARSAFMRDSACLSPNIRWVLKSLRATVCATGYHSEIGTLSVASDTVTPASRKEFIGTMSLCCSGLSLLAVVSSAL